MNDSQSTTKRTMLDDIAAELGISKSTVSRAISGKGRISAETREKVQECIKERNYRPNIIAKSLSESRTYNLGVVIPMDSNETEAPFFQTCLMGICRECAVRDYDAVVISTDKNDLSQLARVVQNRKVDGVIVTRPTEDNGIEQLLRDNGIPFVVVGKSVVENVVSVDSSHEDGCRELTSYLLMSNPPETVGLLMNNMEYTVNQSRYKGFESAFAAIGTKPSENMVYVGIESPMQFSKSVTALLKEEPKCIICGDDIICMKLLAELNNLGKSIPQDIRVASFYDSVYLDNYSPPITSLIFNASELGAASASVLIDMLNGVVVNKSTNLSFEMLIRKSTM